MKKLLSLFLALLLCLNALPAAIAEEAPAAEAAALPDVDLPITLTAYQQAYENVIAENAPDCTVTWRSVEQEGSTVWTAIINDAFASVLLLVEDGNVTEVACLVQNDLSEDALLTFLSMCGYSGAALLVDEDTDAAAASDAFMTELYAAFIALSQGTSMDTICGLPGGISLSAVDETTFQYYFILKLTQAEAE